MIYTFLVFNQVVQRVEEVQVTPGPTTTTTSTTPRPPYVYTYDKQKVINEIFSVSFNIAVCYCLKEKKEINLLIEFSRFQSTHCVPSVKLSMQNYPVATLFKKQSLTFKPFSEQNRDK